MVTVVACTMLFALVVYQTFAAHQYETAADTWRAAHQEQRKHAAVAVRKLECFVNALPEHQLAAARGDARKCNAILFAAVAAANAIQVDQ
jgi:hypothetical protein